MTPRTACASDRSRRRIRVAIPLAGFNLSGGVKSLIGVANALAIRGHETVILAPDFAARPPVALHPSVRVRVLASGPRRLPTPLRKLIHLLRLSATSTADCDVCLANYFTTAYVACLSRLVRRDRAVLAYNVRGYEPDSHGLLAEASAPSRLVRWALAWLSYRLPLQKICTTAWLRERVGDPSAYVVGHGIDLDTFRPPPQRTARARLVIGTIGRAGEAKGYPDFLRAIERLAEGLQIDLVIAAPAPVPLPTGVPAKRVEATSETAMADFYHACDVFVFSSRGEGFGLPPLEAMACGCAVITTNCGGVREFARPDENCLMTPPAAPSALALAIERLVADEGLRRRLADAGVRTAQGWSRDVVLDRFCEFLEGMADESGG